MREEIFESRGLTDSGWVYGYCYPDFEDHKIMYILSKDDGIVYPVKKESIGYFIGLYDLAGRRVYSKDILQKPNSSYKSFKEGGERAIVTWYPELARFGLEFYSVFGGEGYSGKSQHISDYIAKGWEVIGNTECDPHLMGLLDGNVLERDLNNVYYSSENYMKCFLSYTMDLFPAIAIRYGIDLDTHVVEIDYGTIVNRDNVYGHLYGICEALYERFGEALHIIEKDEEVLNPIEKVLFKGKGKAHTQNC